MPKHVKKRRSMLYIPGNNAAMIQQGGVYGADCVLLDLEDSISPSEKDAARILLKHAIPAVNFYGAGVVVRVNHLDTPFGYSDLEEIVPIQPNGLRLPKIESAKEVVRVIRVIEEIEEAHHLPHDKLTVEAMIETAIGVENALEIANASQRISAIAIGGQDLAADMGISLENGATSLDYASQRIVMAAKAAHIDVMDTVFVDIDDEDGLREAALHAKHLGFTGKAAINPRQIDIINEVFTPGEKEIADAIDIIAAYNRHMAVGVGVFAINGKMVDAPVVARAQRILDLADIDAEQLQNEVTVKTSIGTELPDFIDKKKGRGTLKPFEGAWTRLQKGWMDEPTVSLPTKAKMPHASKMAKDLKAAIEKTNPRDGMTVSFHHHLRNGDAIVNRTIDILAELGIKNITLAASSLSDVHSHLIPYLEDGTITEIWTSGMRGELGKAVSMGKLAYRAVIHSHGGRARAIRTGELSIDLAVLAASAADEEGNATGCHGPSAFGSMGYAIMDSRYAKQVIVATDNLVPYPCFPVSIEQTNVDYVVRVDSLGDINQIASGTTRITKKPLDLRIARLAAKVIEHSGFMENGYSFQVGAGGASLATARYVNEIMKMRGIKGSFLLGGVTSYVVELMQQGLFHSVFDVQSFDAAVSSSLLNNRSHIEISSDMYANPFNCGNMVNKLDIVVLGALGVDLNFNVNVVTSSEGAIMGASGGHCDAAAGTKLAIVACPSFRGRIPTIKRKVNHVVTPGESIDVVVTERGICVNPDRPNLEDRLRKAGLPIRKIEDLHDEVDSIVGVPDPVEYDDKVVAVIEYRDGTTIDVIRQSRQ